MLLFLQHGNEMASINLSVTNRPTTWTRLTAVVTFYRDKFSGEKFDKHQRQCRRSLDDESVECVLLPTVWTAVAHVEELNGSSVRNRNDVLI